MKKCNCSSKYKEVDVVFSTSGRLRIRVQTRPEDPLNILNKLKRKNEITKGSFNNIINTFTFEYEREESDVNANRLLLNFCGLYAQSIGVNSLKLNYKLPSKNTMGYSSFVSLAFILADLGLNFMGVRSNVGGLQYRNFIRWSAVVTSIGAIFEHGYKELSENGAFDPEVMSIMYLLNSINKNGVVPEEGTVVGLYSPIIAWLLTFGRHILRRQNRSIMLGIMSKNGELKVIEEESGTYFFNQFMGSCMDVYQNVSVRKSFMK